MKAKRVILGVLVMLGVTSTAYYFSWWFRDNVLSNPLLLAPFLIMLFYITSQALFVWAVYLHAEIPSAKPRRVDQELSVDLFLPTYHEPIDLIENTIRAAVAMRYPHTTYVLDDGHDDNVRTVALSLGAKYLRRADNRDQKAGNINHALKESSGDLVVIFDIDHVPDAKFLDRVVPYFDDAHIGVVQVPLDHYNGDESYVAAAAGRMNDEFFSATMHGMNSMGCAMVFGSNAVFRRSALLSLGGYKPGLAEDLNTSVHLHAAGWKSAYVPEILAKGLLPPDLDAFYKRQFKWSRGVFDVLINELPPLFRRLTPAQRICYLIRMTYYLAGPVIGLHVLVGILAPFLSPGVEWLKGYFLSSIPFLISYVVVHAYAHGQFALRPINIALDLRGHLIILASWPVYTLALVSSILKTQPKFVSTPKRSGQKLPLGFLVLQVVAMILLVLSLGVHFQTSPQINWEYVFLVGVLVFMHFAALPTKTIMEVATNRRNGGVRRLSTRERRMYTSRMTQ